MEEDPRRVSGQPRVVMEDHRGDRALRHTQDLANHTDTIAHQKSFYTNSFYTHFPFSFNNLSSNFIDLCKSLAGVIRTVVSDDEDIMANLWNLHSEALIDILDLTLDFDILELPPPIIEEVPDWYVNFINSDREPAKSPPRPTPLPLPEPSPPVLNPELPDLPPVETSPPELTWEEYLKLGGLEEVEAPSDEESLPQSPMPFVSPIPVPQFLPDESNTSASIEPESSMEWQHQRRNWISKEKVAGSGPCPAENTGHMLTLITMRQNPPSSHSTMSSPCPNTCIDDGKMASACGHPNPFPNRESKHETTQSQRK